jgi:hypothetical protein
LVSTRRLGRTGRASARTERAPVCTAGADTTARVADVVPGPTRLNVVAGRRAMVAGHVSPAVAHRRIALEKRTSVSWYGPGLYGRSLACGGA